jgi:hypothetical protein
MTPDKVKRGSALYDWREQSVTDSNDSSAYLRYMCATQGPRGYGNASVRSCSPTRVVSGVFVAAVVMAGSTLVGPGTGVAGTDHHRVAGSWTRIMVILSCHPTFSLC